MLIGPLVRRLAASAPGLTIQVLPRAPDPVRLLRDGEADLVIEPVEIMPEVTLPWSPNGLPIATTPSPTASLDESASSSGWSADAGASILTTARSVDASLPTTVAL